MVGRSNRTWAGLPWPAGLPVAEREYAFEPADGRSLYLMDARTFRVLRSTDYGQRWEDLGLSFGPSAEGLGLSAIGLPTGELVVGLKTTKARRRTPCHY